MKEKLKILLELFSVLFKIGLCTFGGGIAMLPILERELAEKRKWTTSDELLDWFAIGQSTPGIIAVNVATFIGNKRAGVIGGIVGTLGMVFPSLIVITVIAKFISNFSSILWVQSALKGINIAVAALLTRAVWNFARKAVKNLFALVLFLLSFSAIYFFNVSTVWIIVFSIFIGVLLGSLKGEYSFKPTLVIALILSCTFLLLYFVPKKNLNTQNISTQKIESSSESEHLELSLLTEKTSELEHSSLSETQIPLIRLFFIFVYVGLVTIGGGLVAITVMQQLIVEKYALIGIDMFYNMVAVSESTPGPMGINMATYIGCELYGPFGACVTTLGQVIPSIVCILLIANFFAKFSERAGVKAAFSTLRPSVTGVIAVAAVKVFVLTLLNLPDSLSDFLTLDAWTSLLNISGFLFYLAGCLILFKTKLHPILLVILGGIFGVIFA